MALDLGAYPRSRASSASRSTIEGALGTLQPRAPRTKASTFRQLVHWPWQGSQQQRGCGARAAANIRVPTQSPGDNGSGGGGNSNGSGGAGGEPGDEGDDEIIGKEEVCPATQSLLL